MVTINNIAMLYQLLPDSKKPSHYARKISYASAYNNVEPEFLPYIHKIEDYLGHQVPNFKIRFVSKINSKSIDAVGSCNHITKTINVKKSTWVKYSDTVREILLVHEIGHCYYGLDHNEKIMKDGCPQYMMHPQIIPVKCYIKHRNYYLSQLRDS